MIITGVSGIESRLTGTPLDDFVRFAGLTPDDAAPWLVLADWFLEQDDAAGARWAQWQAVRRRRPLVANNGPLRPTYSWFVYISAVPSGSLSRIEECHTVPEQVRVQMRYLSIDEWWYGSRTMEDGLLFFLAAFRQLSEPEQQRLVTHE